MSSIVGKVFTDRELFRRCGFGSVGDLMAFVCLYSISSMLWFFVFILQPFPEFVDQTQSVFA